MRESVERVRSALKNCGGAFPHERVTVNLAPADLRKEGAGFDLAIAAGILQASRQLLHLDMERCLIVGELSLDGRIRPVRGVLPMVEAAKRHGLTHVLVSAENVEEATLIEGMHIAGIDSLRQLLDGTVGERIERAPASLGLRSRESDESLERGEDFADVRGQYQAKRALTVAAAGMHNAIFIGPPGSGKTMLIRRLPTILPPLSDEESLEVTKVYSAAGRMPVQAHLIRDRPFRHPHHTVTVGGLIGAGSYPKPGEASLAHRGVLFLDELPEFSRAVLETLRQPLEERRVTIGRAKAVTTFPSHFILMAAMNPCPCGFLGSSGASSCTCSPIKVQQYRSRLSGPLLDRIDMHIEVPRLDYAALQQDSSPTSSGHLRKQVLVALKQQRSRYEGKGIRFNSELYGRLLRTSCRLQPDAERMLADSFDVLGLSARSLDRILKIARTIADLEASEQVLLPHLAEALQYRVLDRQPL